MSISISKNENFICQKQTDHKHYYSSLPLTHKKKNNNSFISTHCTNKKLWSSIKRTPSSFHPYSLDNIEAKFQNEGNQSISCSFTPKAKILERTRCGRKNKKFEFLQENEKLKTVEKRYRKEIVMLKEKNNDRKKQIKNYQRNLQNLFQKYKSKLFEQLCPKIIKKCQQSKPRNLICSLTQIFQQQKYAQKVDPQSSLTKALIWEKVDILEALLQKQQKAIKEIVVREKERIDWQLEKKQMYIEEKLRDYKGDMVKKMRDQEDRLSLKLRNLRSGRRKRR